MVTATTTAAAESDHKHTHRTNTLTLTNAQPAKDLPCLSWPPPLLLARLKLPARAGSETEAEEVDGPSTTEAKGEEEVVGTPPLVVLWLFVQLLVVLAAEVDCTKGELLSVLPLLAMTMSSVVAEEVGATELLSRRCVFEGL